MSEPCIITVAITGSVARKIHNPAVPETVTEQIESTHEAFEAGALLVHVHSRNDDGSPCTDADKFAEFQAGIRRHCPGIIVQFSTGGRSGKGSERGSMLHHRPDMASLATGSCNFPKSIYENSNELIEELARKMLEYEIKPEIEVFDLAMLYNAARLQAEGLLRRPLHVQFVLGVVNALPAHRDILEFELEKLKQLLPKRPGLPPVSADRSSRSIVGASNSVVICAPASRTTFASIPKPWHHRTPLWSPARQNSATSTIVIPRLPQRPVPF